MNQPMESRPHDLQLTCGGWELLDRIEPLWNQQRDFHFELAPQWIRGMTEQFSVRRVALVTKGVAGGFLVVAKLHGQDVGYGISTLMAPDRGELDSLFVVPACRSQGIGHALMQATLAWFAQQGVDDIAIELLDCNAGARRFYAGYGFEPRSLVMKRPPSSGNVFQVWRIDDNGNVFAVGEPTSERDARCLVEQYEARGHKQMYWVARAK